MGQPDAEDRLLRDAVEQATQSQRQSGHAADADGPLLHAPVGVQEHQGTGGQAESEGPGPGCLEAAARQLTEHAGFAPLGVQHQHL